MSSGACRALVALLLTLVATIVMAVPVVAKNESLIESSSVRYSVHPTRGTIDVTLTFILQTRGQVWQAQDWRQAVIEELAKPDASRGFSVAGSRDLPGPWEAVDVTTPKIDGGNERATFAISYTLDASVDQGEARMRRIPARVDDSYVFLCVPGQDTHLGTVKIDIDGSGWQLTQLGTVMLPTDTGFKTGDDDRRTPGQVFTCIEGVRSPQLARDTYIGPADRTIELQAWTDSANWLSITENTTKPILDEIHRFLGHDIPGDGPLVVRQAPIRDIGGYASAHGTPGVVQVDERGGTDPQWVRHELAHAWFGTDNFTEAWLREGLAAWTATAIAGSTCAPATTNPTELVLQDWQVVEPTSGEDYAEGIATQEAAACGIVSAVAARMPAEQWSEVIGSMLKGETKYIGSAGPETGTFTTVDFREFLDAVDERGLVPAADDPAYAANRDELDFAQDLLDDFGIPNNGPELARRSEARTLYHQFLDDAAPLGAPHAVRKDMDDWNFERAIERIGKSYEVYEALTEANSLLPGNTNLIAIMQPDFEAAKDEQELDAVAERTMALLEGATSVYGPLGDLQEALPPGWTMPAAVRDAISDQRFDDIMEAITPAIAGAQEISAADAALPQADLLEKYKARFENTTTANKLAELAADAAAERRNAERAGYALDLLENKVGDWTIPDAVTNPLVQGQLQTGITVINDALAVVEAASAADLALPQAGLREEVRPLFEGVVTAADMATLRAHVEQRAGEAEAVGNALSTLRTLVEDWTIPSVIADPVAAGDFASAVASAEAAQRWIKSAFAAEEDLPEIEALVRTRPDFESATSLEELQEGATLAEDWAEAASYVRRAINKSNEERDMLTSFGLWGVDTGPILQEAMDAAIAGDVATAINKSSEVIATIDGGSGAGSLRLAGIVFFGVAVLGVLGLWIMLRRQAGPSWARSTTPHWIEDGRRGPFRRGKKKDD